MAALHQVFISQSVNFVIRNLFILDLIVVDFYLSCPRGRLA